jgi:toluene monooxygenase system protein E
MSDENANASSKPLKTWTHLQKARKRPNEYAIVSTNLHFSTDVAECPWELDQDLPVNAWFRKNREGSPLQHSDWDAFRDPDELVYRTYNILQDGQENYVCGLLEDFAEREHDAGLEREWLATLSLLYTPSRYLLHALQMASAYLVQMAPASTISNCAIFQAGDCLRWLSHTAYRTRELANACPELGFADAERRHWEEEPAWQGFRELVERALVVYDWGEAFVVLNLVLKPAVDEALFRELGRSARVYRDDLLSLMCESALRDSDRQRRWTGALVEFALQETDNRQVILDWLERWTPLGEQAIEAWCAHLPGEPGAAQRAQGATAAFRNGLNLT